ncbi:unnamed protein product [Clonostachys rosea f. rosea IK726]|uniref:N-acetylglucosamine-induced protein 1 n=2 Tax=Bionectria ochroleuca TaxID=29856 RepID=A0A0B7JPB2_BIOOC|nr:unnamed protein product [Clonostachys rosea f. rosea IK726]
MTLKGCVRVPYWNMNVPDKDHTEACPNYLLNLSDKDVGILSTPDSQYEIQTWDQVCQFVDEMTLAHFQRLPSDLRRYRAYMHELIERYGSVTNFMLRERLQWEEPVKPKGVPFKYQEDYKILHNDWPYGIDNRIVHLVVWTKFVFQDDPATGRLNSEGQEQIGKFVYETFSRHLKEGHVRWFRNWTSLKSVHSVEHIHIMLFDPDPDFVRQVTSGDLPLTPRSDA